MACLVRWRCQPHDFVEDAVRHFALGHFRERQSRPSRANSVTMLVSSSKPAPSAVTSLATIRSAFLAAKFFAAFSATLLGFRGKSDDQAVAFFARHGGENIGFGGSSASVMHRQRFLYFLRSGSAGR